MKRALLSFGFALGTLVACMSSAGGNEPFSTAAALDVSGASNAPCTLTISGNGIATSTTFDIAAPSPAVVDAPAGPHPPLTWCKVDDAAAVNVTTTGQGCVRASRTATQLCFSQDGCLGAWQTADRACPVTITLTCNGQKLYDNVSWTLCQWFG